jgi:hypothetical protein
MNPWLLLMLDSLATYRLTRLAVKDSLPLLAGPRQWVERRTLGTRLESLGDLVTCHWCASGWIAMAVVGYHRRQLRAAQVDPVTFWLATWAVGAMLAHLEPEK